MRFRIPIFTVRSLIDVLRSRAVAPSSDSGARPAWNLDPESTQPWREVFTKHRGTDAVAEAWEIKLLRKQWLGASLLENCRDLLSAARDASPSPTLLRSVFADSKAEPVGGGTFHRPTFDERVEYFSITRSTNSQPQTGSLTFGRSLGATLDDVEQVFGKLDVYQVGHNDDDTVFQLPGHPSPQLRFYLAGGWETLPDGNYRQRLRFSSEQRLVPREEAVPERMELNFPLG